MKNKLKRISLCLGFFALIICGFLFSSCCSPSPSKISVHFEGADERLGLKDYTYDLAFNGNLVVSFTVPKGYDHTKISATINGNNIANEEVVFEEGKTVEEGYEYTLDKTITYRVNFIKRDSSVVVNLTDMQKLKFDIVLDKDMENFTVLSIPEEKTENLFLELLESEVIEQYSFTNHKASIEYGNYIVLKHNINSSKQDYDAIYSNITHFTSDRNKSNLGSLEFATYNKAVKGNTDYLYNKNRSGEVLYYIGELKEDVSFQTTIPNYIEDKGFDIERKPNTFYLYTNLSDYNSEMFSLDAYAPTNEVYDQNNPDMDIIDGKTVKKVSPFDIHKDRYAIYKIYLGLDKDTDVLLNQEDKEDLNTGLYFVLSSSIGLENINFKMLADEFERPTNQTYKLNVSDTLTGKGKSYLKMDSASLEEFSLDRDYVSTTGNIYNYKTGLAILYPEVDYYYFGSHKQGPNPSTGTDLRVCKNVVISSSDPQITNEDINVELYISNDGGITKDYGITDNHFWPDNRAKVNCSYFKVEDLFTYKNEGGEDEHYGWVYNNNLYMTLKGEKYKNFRSVRINRMEIKINGEALTTAQTGPLQVIDAKEFNGYADYNISEMEYNYLGEYTLLINVYLESIYSTSAILNFSQLETPNNYTQGLYISRTLNSEILGKSSKTDTEKLTGFTFVNGGNKTNASSSKDTEAYFKNIEFSSYIDLYYFVKCSDPNYDIEIRLDASDPTTAISSSKTLLDIKGDKVTIEINGEAYYIKVLKQDIIYELLEKNTMYVVKK